MRINLISYNRFTELHFLKIGGYKPIGNGETMTELDELALQVQSCEGRKAKKTQRASVDGSPLLFVAGYPVPLEYDSHLQRAGCMDYYLE